MSITETNNTIRVLNMFSPLDLTLASLQFFTNDSYLYLLHKVIYMSSLNPQYFYRGKISLDYLPQCARKNRKIKSFATELPQGEDDFISKRKRQFAVLHNQSEIKDQNLLQLQNKKLYLHSNLDVHDIEGAYPNSLNIRQAQKKIIKGINNKNTLEKIERDNERLINDHYGKMKTADDQELSRKQKHDLLNRKNERKQLLKNYHYLIKGATNTEPNTIESSPNKDWNIAENDEVRPNFKFSKHLPKNSLDNVDNPTKYYNKCHDSINTSHQVKNIKFEKQIDHQHHIPIPSKPNTPKRKNNAKSLIELNNMWHGAKKMRVIPYNQIRKYSPTYLSVLSPPPTFDKPPVVQKPVNPEQQGMKQAYLLPKIN